MTTEVYIMTEYIVIGVVIVALTIACIITAKTAKRVSILLAKATKEVVEIVGDIRKANEDLAALRKELEADYKIGLRKSKERCPDDRRTHDRRKGDRRTAESRRLPEEEPKQQDPE